MPLERRYVMPFHRDAALAFASWSGGATGVAAAAPGQARWSKATCTHQPISPMLCQERSVESGAHQTLLKTHGGCPLEQSGLHPSAQGSDNKDR